MGLDGQQRQNGLADLLRGGFRPRCSMLVDWGGGEEAEVSALLIAKPKK